MEAATCAKCGNRPAPLRFLDTNICQGDDPDAAKYLRNYCFACGATFLPKGTIDFMYEMWSSGKMDDNGFKVRPAVN